MEVANKSNLVSIEAMTELKYYTLVTLNSNGKRQLKEIQVAKVFFTETFSDFLDIHSESDGVIQQKLWELYASDRNKYGLLAQRCLLCFISWQIERECVSLERKFGDYHGFTSRDLLGYVLDDDGSLPTSNSNIYQSLGREILATFDPEKSSLATWTTRKVKQHKELNKFLLECGLYVVSDWAILNDTKLQQLPKIIDEFHGLTNLEVIEAQKYLQAYHKIYRTERFRQRANQKVKGRCSPPTIQQLEAIIDILQTQEIENVSIQVVMYKLQKLASQLREYRIYVRGGSLPIISLDGDLQDNYSLIENLPDPNSINRTGETDTRENFLKTYRQQMTKCLDDALKNVIESRLYKISRRSNQNKNLNSEKEKQKIDKANKFLQALQLFHCQRLSMGKIAQKLGLRAQDAVARLLKLKEFRADVSQETLVKLKQQVVEIAQEYSTPSSLVSLEARITEALEEQMANVISQAEVEAASMQNNSQISYFSQRLCQQLENQEQLKIDN